MDSIEKSRNTASATQLKILVTGPTGTTGRAVVQQLLDRGHRVTGLSRNPHKWGTHTNYTPVKGSQSGDVEVLAKIVNGHDAVVSAFAPSHSKGLATYSCLIEGAWRIKEAVKRSKSKPYLLYVGGAGSLLNPETGKITLDEPETLWHRYLFYGPIEHLNWLRGVIDIWPMHLYYQLRDYAHSDRVLAIIPRLYTNFFEHMMIRKTTDENELTMPHACRAAVSFFEHDHSFDWTFLSPPWFYRDGISTGTYGTIKDFQPVDKDGRFLGVYNGDLALAIADEVEGRQKKWHHWSCYAKQQDTAYFYDNYKNVIIHRYENK